MTEILHREAVYLWYYFTIQFEQIVVWWAVGIAVGSIISVFAKDKIHALFDKMRNQRWGVFGIIPAALLGIASPLCMYGTIPIAASFANKGMREDWLAAFMMSSVLLNPQLIMYSAALGTTAMAIRIVSCTLCGIGAGFFVWLFYRNKKFFSFGKMQERASHDTDPNLFLRLFKNIWRNIKATGPYFLVGIILSVLFQRYVPQDIVTNLFGGNEAWGVLMAATIGVPLYACGGGTIPLIQEWLIMGMGMGSASAFMLTGPATKITNLGALKIVLGIKHFVLYIVYIMVFALWLGLIINLML